MSVTNAAEGRHAPSVSLPFAASSLLYLCTRVLDYNYTQANKSVPLIIITAAPAAQQFTFDSH